MNIQEKKSPNIFEFGNHILEEHVETALQAASRLANERPITAADLLRAVHIVNGYGIKSPAFSKFTSLLPLIDVPVVSIKQTVTKFHLSQGLAEAYSVANKFFSAGKRVWGRDFITFVLLAEQDPTLYEIANESGTAVDLLQDKWFDYITSTKEHRTLKEWERWWQAAGVPVTSDRMNTRDLSYLLTWNPDRFDPSEIEKYAQEITESGSTLMKWSTGARRYVSHGDRVFLIRQGVEPRGLVGAGEIEGVIFEEVVYEGYAAGGVGIVVMALTDNKNRAAAEIRHIFSRHGSSFAAQGSVSRGFERKGQIFVDAASVEEDKLMDVALEAGADDMRQDGDQFEILTDPNVFSDVIEALEKAEIETKGAEVGLVPTAPVPVTEKSVASSIMRFINDLEDNDDVQNVYSNMDVPDEIMAELAAE